ncbi:MAG: peptidoglycan bridge formation glycyltransferase FemA/FemB family protein [Candidatus Pacearchaeota archaeon]
MKDINATVIVDLTPNEEEIMKNLDKDARWGIKKAIKNNLIVEETNKEEDLKEFYKIYEKELKEKIIRVETFEHLKENMDILFVCKKDNKIIAGATLKIKNNIPTLTRNASLKEYLSFHPNNLLYWNLILWSKKNGYKKLDLGGYQIKPRGNLIGINKFKERWGEIVYYYDDYPFYKAIGRKLIRNFGFFWWLNKKMKRKIRRK